MYEYKNYIRLCGIIYKLEDVYGAQTLAKLVEQNEKEGF